MDKSVPEKSVLASGSNDPFSSASGRPSQIRPPTDVEAATTELEKVTSLIESERQRWKDALDVINELTANKTRAVREGSPAYNRCMEASKIIQEVESGASDLKAKKAQLEARIKELEE
ncbi:hypothetical protein [Luteolibacter soli]|uniref:Uncharacterized protein n=1 Tax=Luteolibacter soli TaxID=3135280 RepID=A0ABU9B2R8_9BACT